MLITLKDGNGGLILSIVWALALVGILSAIFLSGSAVTVARVVPSPGVAERPAVADLSVHCHP